MKLDKLVKTTTNGVKRRGRGYGSGKGGHTIGRGAKGQKARNNISVGFEGGQIPLYKKLPKLSGFKNPTKKEIGSISLTKLNVFKEDSEVTPETLVERGIFKKLPKYGVKILANGELEKKLTLKGFMASKAAIEKIEKSGSKLS